MKNFKDSGIEWLGEIPEHWEVVTLKYLVEKIIGGGTPDTSNLDYWTNNKKDGYLWVSIEDITKSSFITDTKRYITQNGLKSSSAKLIPPFSILYSIYASLGKIAYSDQILTTNQAILGIQSNHKLVFYKFLFYYLCNTTNYVTILSSMTTQNNISLSVVANLKIPLPPLKEQEQIANFLDEKCEKIKNFIEKKEKLINLLKEQKQALINETITKGLDKNVNFKDSGIEYLGEIPQHWKVVRLGLILKTSSGTTPDSGNDKYYKGGQIVWINSGDLNDGFLKDSKRKITQDALDDYSVLKIFDKDSLIIAMYGATIGKTAILKVNACVNQACCVLEKSAWYNTFYLFYLFNRYKKELISMGSGGGQPNISQDIIKNLKIPLPPLKEQEQIANFLDEKCKKIDLLIEKTEKQIKLIKEYKTALINQAICGRIRKN
ncbi:restriction endonuclease subunit S [Campylobacter sp. LMG 7929]|uniref:restriction endonuclease subunit S n=1 Tax=Campylobacter sp. LMG 7929 TaxID=2735749 RepID=UPI00301C8F56|nr:restriction endonuclease subunit S [Campylobacter sp. LMG 7929]